MVLVGEAAVDHAHSSSEFEVRHAFSANSSVIFHASIFVFLAGSVFSDVETTFTGVTSVVVVSLAVSDATVVL